MSTLPPTTPPSLPTASPLSMGVPVNTVSQNILGNVAGLGTIAAANGGVAIANSFAGLGTAEATAVAQVQGFFAGVVKHSPHFDEDHWLDPFMAIIGLPIAYLLHGGLGAGLGLDVVALLKAGITSIQGAKLAKVEYHAAQATVAAGMVKPVAPENEYARQAHPWPSPNSPGWGMTPPPPQSASPPAVPTFPPLPPLEGVSSAAGGGGSAAGGEVVKG